MFIRTLMFGLIYSHVVSFWADMLSCMCWCAHMCSNLWASVLICTLRFGLVCSYILSWASMLICSLIHGLIGSYVLISNGR